MSRYLAHLSRECYGQLHALDHLVQGRRLEPLAEVAVDMARRLLKGHGDALITRNIEERTAEIERARTAEIERARKGDKR